MNFYGKYEIEKCAAENDKKKIDRNTECEAANTIECVCETADGVAV